MKSVIEKAQDIQAKMDKILKGLDPFDIAIAGEVNDYSKAMDKVDILADKLKNIIIANK